MRFLKPIAIAVVLAAQLSASAAEIAVLRNGFTIQFVRKQQMGDKTRLFTSTGFIDVATEEIVSFDKDDPPPVAPDAPMVVPAANTTNADASDTQSSSSSVPGEPSNSVTAGKRAPMSKEEIDAAVREAGSRHQLDPDFINSVIKAESNFHPHAVSRKGAQGLMQLMPQTASKLGVSDPFDPKANIEAGTAHLSALMDLYHNDAIKALAAYNAGAHRVQQYHGVPPYRETRAYVAKIVRDYNAKKRAQMQMAAATAKATSTPSSATKAPVAKSGSAKTAATASAASRNPAKNKAAMPDSQQANSSGSGASNSKIAKTSASKTNQPAVAETQLQ